MEKFFTLKVTIPDRKMILPVIQCGSPILRKKAFNTDKGDDYAEITRNMMHTLKNSRGIGLAGPQVWLLKNVFVIDTSPMKIDGVMESNGSENTIKIAAEAYWQSVGGRGSPVGEAFKYDGSNIRVREAVLGYTKSFNSRILRNINVSLVGYSLFFIMNKAERLDPNMMVCNSNYQGVEGFGLPSIRTIGIEVLRDP